MAVQRIVWPQRFERTDRYFQCDICGRRILIRRSSLDAFNPKPSPFAVDTCRRFDEHSRRYSAFDFSCPRCGTAYRLAFSNQERGMGGPWIAVVHFALCDDETVGDESA